MRTIVWELYLLDSLKTCCTVSVPKNVKQIEKQTLTSRNRCLIETSIFTLLVKKFSIFYGSRSSTIIFKRIRHWSLSSAWWIQSPSSNHISLKSILIFSPIYLCASKAISCHQIFWIKFYFIYASLTTISAAQSIGPIALYRIENNVAYRTVARQWPRKK
jgi:hypothetical protein